MHTLKGVHYDIDTFAAAPDVTVRRTLQALACGLGWEWRTYDVSTAYLQADATSDEDRIPLIYPKGMAKYDYRGNELRGVLISNLYGHPAAGARWAKTRDTWILDFFNNEETSRGWRVYQCHSDPCLFVFDSPDHVTSLVLIYVDDVDSVGPDDAHLKYIRDVYKLGLLGSVRSRASLVLRLLRAEYLVRVQAVHRCRGGPSSVGAETI